MGTPLGDCPQASFRDAREYLSSWVARNRQGARLIEYEPRPDKSKVLAQNQWAGGSLRSWVDSGQAVIAWRRGAREFHEILVTNVLFSHSQLSGVGGQTLESMQGEALGVLGWRSASGPVSQRHFDVMWGNTGTRCAPSARCRAIAIRATAASSSCHSTTTTRGSCATAPMC